MSPARDPNNLLPPNAPGRSGRHITAHGRTKRSSLAPMTCAPPGQAAVAQKREGQMVGAADPLDAALGRRGDLLEGVQALA